MLISLVRKRKEKERKKNKERAEKGEKQKRVQPVHTAAIDNRILRLCFTHTHAHIHTLARSHSHMNPFNSAAVPLLRRSSEREMNDFSELSHLSPAVPVRTGFNQLMRK